MGAVRTWFGTAGATHTRFGQVRGGELSAAITLAAFLSIFPLLLVGVALLGFVASDDPTLAADAAGRLGLTGDAAKLLTDTVETARESRGGALGLGTLGLLWSGLGVVATLQAAFAAAWQVSTSGWRAKVRAIAWIAGTSVLLASSAGLAGVLGALPAWTALAIPVGFAVDLALWLWTFRLLSSTDVPWRAHLPGAVLGAVGLGALKAVGALWVPRAVAASSALYGSLGVVFAVLAWLALFGRLAVYAVSLNVVRWEARNGTVAGVVELPRLPDAPRAAQLTRSGARAG